MNARSSCAARADPAGSWRLARSPARTTSTCGRAPPTSCIVEPKAGRHLTHATRDRKGPRFVDALQRIGVATRSSHHGQFECARAESPHGRPRRGAGGCALGAVHVHAQAWQLAEPAEIEASLWSRECHGIAQALRERAPGLIALGGRSSGDLRPPRHGESSATGEARGRGTRDRNCAAGSPDAATLSAARPTLSAAQLTLSAERPTLSAAQLTLSAERPTLSAAQLTLPAERPTLSAAQLTLPAERPTLSAAQLTLPARPPPLSAA